MAVFVVVRASGVLAVSCRRAPRPAAGGQPQRVAPSGQQMQPVARANGRHIKPNDEPRRLLLPACHGLTNYRETWIERIEKSQFTYHSRILLPTADVNDRNHPEGSMALAENRVPIRIPWRLHPLQSIPPYFSPFSRRVSIVVNGTSVITALRLILTFVTPDRTHNTGLSVSIDTSLYEICHGGVEWTPNCPFHTPVRLPGRLPV
jgi:hypothetical protein